MANTHLMKTLVEPYVRQHLEANFGQPFSAQFLPLPGGGRHEFDAVSNDGTVVTSIKSHSGRTSGGNRPGGKILACYAELYYLLQVDAPTKILVLTNPEFFEIFDRDCRHFGRLAPGLGIKLVELPPEMQARITAVSQEASREMAGSRAVADEVAELVVTGDLAPPEG